MVWWLVSLLAWPTTAAIARRCNASRRSKTTVTGDRHREVRDVCAALLLLVVFAVHVTALGVSVLAAGPFNPVLFGALMTAAVAYLYLTEALLAPRRVNVT